MQKIVSEQQISKAVNRSFSKLLPDFICTVVGELSKEGYVICEKDAETSIIRKGVKPIFDKEVLAVAEKATLESLNLPLKSYNPLVRIHDVDKRINTVADLYYASDWDLLMYPYIGKACLDDYKEALTKFAIMVKDGVFR